MDDSATAPTVHAPATEDPFLGKLVGERYRLQGRIGEGGMGLVYRAEHTLMKKTVAVKLLHGELGQVGEAVRRFEREAQSASRLNHPNIIAVTDFGQTATGEFYLAMEYVPGRSLGEALADEPLHRMSVGRALGIVRQMLSALAHAHAQGVVHRDLKPANIMLTRSVDGRSDDVVKILDFGIAKMMTEAAASGGPANAGEPALTQNTMVFGTPSYMSPEQATAAEVDSRADLYSCGVILFELLTGRKPFVANDLARILAMHVTAPPPRFATVAPDARLPAALEEVVMRALEKDRARRFQTADQFAAALESLETAVVPQALAAAAVVRGRRALVGARVISAELLALYNRLPSEFRRWTPLFGVLGVVLMLVIVPTLCSRATNPGATPPAPKAVAEVVTQPLQDVEAAVARGRFVEARAMLLQLLSKYPKEARVHFTLGHLEYVEKKPLAALAAYEQAVRLDPGLRGDAGLLLNLRALTGDRDKRVAQAALTLAIDRIGVPAASLLAEIASDDNRLEMRTEAREACAKLGCSEQIDMAKSLGQDLGQARTCDEKREIVRKLAATKSARAVEVLKKARGVRGALGGLFGGGNDCVRKDIDAALADLGD
jgi:tRNA A-37 threonylcarbamoyl transferase component Bud32/tetratricopeptide (TPR) repeat protein